MELMTTLNVLAKFIIKKWKVRIPKITTQQSITNGMSGVSNAKIEALYRIIYYKSGEMTGKLVSGSSLVALLDMLQHGDTCLIESVRLLT